MDAWVWSVGMLACYVMCFVGIMCSALLCRLDYHVMYAVYVM